MFNNYREQSDLTIMNTIYNRPKKLEDGKWTKGSIDIIAKDNTTGRKILDQIEDPVYPFYFSKKLLNVNLLYTQISNVDLIETEYTNITKKIAELTDNLDFYYDNIRNKNSRANNSLHMHPRVFWSDMAIEDKYRFLFSKKFKNRIIKPTIDFFDIEVDTINAPGFPESGLYPINAITLVNSETKTIYTLLLRNKNNPLIEEFEKATKTKRLYEELYSFIENAVGGKSKYEAFELNKFEVKFLFYDEIDEIRLIQDLFILINELQPDFLLAWNMAFDIPYIIDRIVRLGYDPREIMCHPSFKEKVVNYYVDDNNFDEYAERCDKATISSYTVFLDQMIQYASKRKGQKKPPNYRLDTIGEMVVNVKKLDYSHITRKLKELPYKDYKTFVFYNIMDTIVQYCIEYKEKDIEFVLASVLDNNTRYSKIHRQTTYLSNRAASMFYDYGYVIGNNYNKNNPKPLEKYDGAFVGDPLKISDYSKLKINGFPVMVFDNLDDYDYAALYPNIELEFNASAETQIGKVQIPYKVHNKEGHLPSDGFKFNRSREFAEDYTTDDWLEFCSRWFNLAGYSDILNDVNEYINEVVQYHRNFNELGQAVPIMKYNPDKPVVIYEDLKKSDTLNYAIIKVEKREK